MRNKRGIFGAVLAVLVLAITVFLISCQGVMPYCTVTYVGLDGTVQTESVLNGGRPKLHQYETEQGYESCWLREDGTVFLPTDTVRGDITLTFSAEPIKYPVRYEADGGELPEGNPNAVTVESEPFTLLPAYREGCEFDGWADKNGNIVTALDASCISFEEGAGEIVLTAKWKLLSFEIKYNGLGDNTDNKDNPTSYTCTEEVHITAPSRKGYDFIGWLVGDSNEPVTEYTVPVGTMRELSFTAVWSAHSAVLTVVDERGVSVNIETEFGAMIVGDMLLTPRNGYEVKAYSDPYRTQNIVLPYAVDDYASTIYVCYSPIEYSVTLDYGDGEAQVYRYYTIESDGFSLPIPSREGFTFEGWSDGSLICYGIDGGSFGNKSLHAVWSRNSYPLMFDTVGGTSVVPIQIEYGAEIVFNVTTHRDGMVFGGWYEDAEYQIPFNGGKMPAEAVTLYARWFQNASYRVTYSASENGIAISGSCASGESVTDGSVVTLSAPLYHDAKLFAEWRVNGVSYGMSREIKVLIDGGQINAVAYYRSVHGMEYDISTSSDLLVYTFASSAYLDGNGILSAHQSLSGGAITVDGDYLASLGVGLKVFTLTENGSVSFVYVNITDPSPRPTVKVDFDSAFPNVLLQCDIPKGQSYVYSVNGGDPVEFNGSAVISGIDRSKTNTFTVYSVDGGESYSKTVNAISPLYAEFYNGSFVYGGQTYDLVINSEEELAALIEYVCFVMVVTDAEYDSSVGQFSTMLTFIIGDDYRDVFSADKSLAYSRVFDSISIPYSPVYRISEFGATSPKGKITVFFTMLNTELSEQEKTVIPDNGGILSESDRPDNYGDFYIDSLERTQLIRSLYELEALPFGIRPVFDSSEASQMAKLVYDRARDILRRYVSDGMSDYEKAAAIYGYLGLNVTYDHFLTQMKDDNGTYRSFTSYGALIDGLAVCDGYASAYRIMCLIEGIPCVEIIGTSDGTGHAWNKVLIDDVWYGVDSTWSRVGTDYVTFKYLLVNEAQLVEGGHVENECGTGRETYTTFVASSENDYYDISGRVINSAADIKSIVNSAAARGVTVIELKNLSGKTMEQLFRGYQNSDFNVKRISYTTLNGSNIVYIMIELL